MGLSTVDQLSMFGHNRVVFGHNRVVHYLALLRSQWGHQSQWGHHGQAWPSEVVFAKVVFASVWLRLAEEEVR
ncbi:hypothetical protein AB6D20_027930 (plasmid) [Vibrio splendidus]